MSKLLEMVRRKNSTGRPPPDSGRGSHLLWLGGWWGRERGAQRDQFFCNKKRITSPGAVPSQNYKTWLSKYSTLQCICCLWIQIQRVTLHFHILRFLLLYLRPFSPSAFFLFLPLLIAPFLSQGASVAHFDPACVQPLKSFISEYLWLPPVLWLAQLRFASFSSIRLFSLAAWLMTVCLLCTN